MFPWLLKLTKILVLQAWKCKHFFFGCFMQVPQITAIMFSFLYSSDLLQLNLWRSNSHMLSHVKKKKKTTFNLLWKAFRIQQNSMENWTYCTTNWNVKSGQILWTTCFPYRSLTLFSLSPSVCLWLLRKQLRSQITDFGYTMSFQGQSLMQDQGALVYTSAMLGSVGRETQRERE